MGLLSKCPQCGCMFMPGTACPNCHQGAAGAGSGPSETMVEYARRREQHTLAYSAFMSRGLAGGLVGLLGAIAFGFLMFCGGLPFWFILLAGILLLLAAVVAVFAHMYMLNHKEDLEIHCPACDARLDEMPLNDGHCPGCQVKLV